MPSIFEPSMPRLEKGRNTLPRWLADMLGPSSMSARERKSAGTGLTTTTLMPRSSASGYTSVIPSCNTCAATSGSTTVSIWLD